MRNSIIVICLLMGISADASNSTNKGGNCTDIPVSDVWLCGDGFNTTRAQRCSSWNGSSNDSYHTILRIECKPLNCTEEAEMRSLTTEKPSVTSPTKQDGVDDDSTDFWKIFLTPAFLYGAAAGAALLILLVTIILVAYCFLIRKRGKKKKTLNDGRTTVDLEYGLSEKVHTIKHENPEEAAQPLCSDEDESHPEENEEDYLTPVEDQTGTPILSQSQCETAANQNTHKEPVYANANVAVKKEKVPLSNATTIGGSAADIKKDDDADDKDKEDSTPFDKLEGRHNSAATRYQDLKRIYENCTKGRIYTNLHGKKGKKQDQSGSAKTASSTDSSQGDTKSCDSTARKPSAAYVNMK